MDIFIDTGIFVAVLNSDDDSHPRAKELWKKALKGEFGQIYTSDYVIDETVTLILARTKNHNLAIKSGKYIIDSPRINKIWLNQGIFQQTWEKFQQLKDKKLSFTDCTSITLVETKLIKQIMSFDCGFDGLVSRIF